MIYLAAKIFLYMLLSLALGVAAGWLWRNMQAQKREAAFERKLVAARTIQPEAERAIRARDERFEALRIEYNAREDELAAQSQVLAERNRAIEALEDTCAELRTRLEALEVESAAAAAPGGENGGVLEHALAAAHEEIDRLNRVLAAEQRRVEELGQERELQRRSLAALEQQLELAREQPRAASR